MFVPPILPQLFAWMTSRRTRRFNLEGAQAILVYQVFGPEGRRRFEREGVEPVAPEP
jgi:hypothetical protein